MKFYLVTLSTIIAISIVYQNHRIDMTPVQQIVQDSLHYCRTLRHNHLNQAEPHPDQRDEQLKEEHRNV